MKKGIFCISIDTELLWGRRNSSQQDAFTSDVKKARKIIRKILFLFKKYKIPVTWAVVGKLFLKGDPLWHGKDIIKMIQKTKDQEIGCHSFSHLIFNEKKCSPKKAQEEIKNCLQVAKKSGIKFKSFVYPQNKIGHLKLLEKNGFSSFRGVEPYWFNKIPKGQKPLQILDFLLLLPPPVSEPAKDPSGLINIPGSMLYVSMRGLRKFIPIKIRVIKAKKGLDQAAQERKIFHLWFHPVDFARETERMFLGFKEILQYAASLRNEGKLEIKSMGQIAEDFLRKN